ncbi:Cys/Met metabolism pyridoxal-phosphate-dependent enzyme [Meridianimarinicoccus sp. RP-17]|uniref:Cys/Met metabolism pyridoxal-phosphate-dependent enzyme n=1 Tax=Meridianimarinicoccus zhengii TaxID=2056810 RepID=UPI000DAEED71|nr:Cys/Met metabolism pyridoxal-phosphate-dependent enzyme [Phycocomes zhengii]
MRRTATLCLCLAALPAAADPPRGAVAIGPAAALDCVAGRYRGEPLRIRDDEDGLVQEVRWLTPAGNVLRIDLTGPGCRFIDVRGVGQAEARILPGERP